MKHRLIPIALALILLLTMAACGPGRPASQDTGSTQAQTGSTAPLPPADPSAPPAQGGTAPTSGPESITKEQATDIALNHAGLTADQVQFLHAELDYDRGRVEYDVQFRVGRTEYEYEIDAADGTILSFEQDID